MGRESWIFIGRITITSRAWTCNWETASASDQEELSIHWAFSRTIMVPGLIMLLSNFSNNFWMSPDRIWIIQLWTHRITWPDICFRLGLSSKFKFSTEFNNGSKSSSLLVSWAFAVWENCPFSSRNCWKISCQAWYGSCPRTWSAELVKITPSLPSALWKSKKAFSNSCRTRDFPGYSQWLFERIHTNTSFSFNYLNMDMVCGLLTEDFLQFTL